MKRTPVTPVAVGGYLDGAYAASLSEYGTPTLLPRSGAWVLERPIDGFPYRDALGCYPLFACPSWEELPADLERMPAGVVALSAVPDPFGEYDLPHLRRCFPDLVRPFKEHFVTDLRRRPREYVGRHHRRYAAKSLREIHVDCVDDAESVVDDWVPLYSVLVDRHGIVGIPAFSRTAFAAQLAVPGIVVFRAVSGGETAGMLLWYVQGEVAYYHLGAYSELGYETRASFGLFSSALEYFAGAGVRWVNLGAGAGIDGAGTDGLTRFKRGWSTGSRLAYICGRIFDRAAYARLVSMTGGSPTGYFPAYRDGEFDGARRTNRVPGNELVAVR
jgi:GNAT acetyltransferase-like protein